MHILRFNVEYMHQKDHLLISKCLLCQNKNKNFYLKLLMKKKKEEISTYLNNFSSIRKIKASKIDVTKLNTNTNKEEKILKTSKLL